MLTLEQAHNFLKKKVCLWCGKKVDDSNRSSSEYKCLNCSNDILINYSNIFTVIYIDHPNNNYANYICLNLTEYEYYIVINAKKHTYNLEDIQEIKFYIDKLNKLTLF